MEELTFLQQVIALALMIGFAGFSIWQFFSIIDLRGRPNRD